RRKRLAEKVQSRSRWHGRSHGHDLFILRRLADQALGKDAGVAWRIGRSLGLRAGDDVEPVDAMILVCGSLGRRVALSLLGHDMDQYRPVGMFTHILQHGDQVFEIVPVDRTYVMKSHFLE